MAAKKATSGAAKPKAATGPVHGSYRDMIRDAIIALKERNGSSRSTLKKYVQANNKGMEPGASFDNMFNKAIKSGVEKGEFAQPKGGLIFIISPNTSYNEPKLTPLLGPSGTVKLAKKESPAAKPAATKPAATKKTKTEAPKKAGAPKKSAPTPAKTATTKAKPGPKKGSTNTKKPANAVGRPKANTGKARKSKAPAPAPAVIDTKKVLGKTKSGRVTKGPAKPATPAKKPTAASKKKEKAAAATPAKKATPKKNATPAAAAA
ncbi:MAG: hypothetical protein Q9164_005260 [Protoblastenia rupestris]